jgi:transketolase
VSLALRAQEKLNAQNVKTRVVSMPSWEIFEQQSEEYRNSVLPPDVKARISIEAGSTFGWRRYVGESGDAIGIDHFGASAPGDVLLEKYGFTVDSIVQRAKVVMKNQEMMKT